MGPIFGEEVLPLTVGQLAGARAREDCFPGGIGHEYKAPVGLPVRYHVLSGNVAAERHMGLSAHGLHDRPPTLRAAWDGTLRGLIYGM